MRRDGQPERRDQLGWREAAVAGPPASSTGGNGSGPGLTWWIPPGGCTTAVVVNDGVEGPELGPGNTKRDWSATIEPGGTAASRVSQTASFHPDATSAMVRELCVSSNDPVDAEVKARLQLE